MFGSVPRSSRSCLAAGRARQPRHLALRIVEIAEDDGRRRARLRARRLQLAVLHLAILRLDLLFARLDPLHAERALLHDADFADRHVGIELQVKRLLPRRVEEVEEPDVVRAGVGAVARADAAVVDLRVQAFLRVMAGVGRTHRLAGRGVALLAEHGPELEPHVGELAFPVPLDREASAWRARARPPSSPTVGDVVLGMTRDHAGFAARAAIEIDDHSPVMWHISWLSDSWS